MNCEENRLRTFNSWPANAAVEPRRIAKAGFFSTGRDLEVECFKCGGKISEWNFGDQVMARHRRLNPNCPFVNNPVESDNVPIIANASVPLTSQSTLFRSELARLRTFKDWPIPNIVPPDRLAKSGFFYLQHGDKVKCAFCSGVVGHWELGDDPDYEHRRHFPTCPLHFSLPVGNRPNIDELGIQTHRGPKHPKYATLESRLQTFVSWPSEYRQTPQQLAQAGFYYVGVSDQVRCFHCDLGLRYWDPLDDPWKEHARWFPNCGYVLLVKGDDFVTSVITAHRPYDQKGSRQCTDVELEELMEMPQSLAALNVGLEAERVRVALKQKMEHTGTPFDTADELIEAALAINLASEEPHMSGSRSLPSLSEAPPRTKATSSDSLPHVLQPTSASASCVWTLEEENRRLKEARLCKICMDEEVGVVFLPCGHLVTCVNCAPSLSDCPMCRQLIKATVRTFLS